jgi:hypothetical protein
MAFASPPLFRCQIPKFRGSGFKGSRVPDAGYLRLLFYLIVDLFLLEYNL